MYIICECRQPCPTSSGAFSVTVSLSNRALIRRHGSSPAEFPWVMLKMGDPEC